MPKIRPPREPQTPVMEDHTPPVEPVEIELSGDPSGDTEIELAPQAEPKPEPAPKVEPSGDDALVLAAKATSRAEELQRSLADSQRQIRARDEELARERDSRTEAEENSVLTALAAQQGYLESARRDVRAAKAAGDTDAEIEAFERLSDAKAQISQLETGKQAFENRRETQKTAPPQHQSAQAPLDFEQKIATIRGLPERGKEWLRKHPEFVNDPDMNDKLGATHNHLTKTKGIVQFTDPYFDALDSEFGYKTTPAAQAIPEPQPTPQPERRNMPMTAPVSRDVPSASGQRAASSKVTLSAEERQIARTSFTALDMTNDQKEKLYAQNKAKLAAQRANGQYPTREQA